MALSDISRKQARSDLRSRLNEYTDEKLSDGELGHWLNMGQFDVFNRLGIISDIWYGNMDAGNDVSGHAAGSINLMALPTGALAINIARIVTVVGAVAAHIAYRVIPQVPITTLYGYIHNSNKDNSFAFTHHGEWLYFFWGSGVILTSGAVNIFFIRKPNEMTADTSVWTTILSSVIAGNTFDVSYGGATITFTCVAEATVLNTGVAGDQGAFFVVGANDTATAVNLANGINNVFGAEVSASSAGTTLTVNGSSRITGSATFTSITEATPAYVDVPTEFVDLVILYALSKALGKLGLTQGKQEVDQDIAERFNAINQAYAAEIAMRTREQAPGMQTARG